MDQSLPQAAARSESKKRRRIPALALLATFILLAGGGMYALPTLRHKLSLGQPDYSGLLTDVVTRGSFAITVTDDGYLDSRRNAVLSSKVEGTTTIISIVPEGTLVEEGDVLCELDSSEFRDKAKQQEITLTQAKAALAQAKENVEIQKTQNESDKAAARLNWDLAVLDLKKYQDGEFKQQKSEIEGEIRLKEEELTRAEENYTFSKNMAKKGYRGQNEVEADRIAVTRAQIELDVAKEKLRVLENYEQERMVTELVANAAELEREYERVQRTANSTMTQVNAEYESARLTAEVEQDKYDHLLKQVEACTIVAPQAGQVVYAGQNSRRSEPVVIEEGATIHERQRIINLPDLTQMKVNARIHESAISQMRVGLPVIISVDAVPGEVYHGEVTTISSVPMSGSWPNYDLKEYEAEISVSDEPEKISKLKPGLTAQLEILVKHRDDVLQVPVQAVVSVGSQRFAYVLGAGAPARRMVRTGETNDKFIEILDGLSTGEMVVLNASSAFADEINELQSRSGMAGPSERPKVPAETGEDSGKDVSVPPRADSENASSGKDRPAVAAPIDPRNTRWNRQGYHERNSTIAVAQPAHEGRRL